MAKKKLKKLLEGHITISKITSDEQYIEVRIGDKLSESEFVQFKMSLEDFAKAVTGQGYIRGYMEVRGLDIVGKKMEHKELIFPVNDIYEGKKEAEKDCQKHCDKGWIADNYFSSQGSIQKHSDGKYYAHGIQRRYVEVDE